MSWRRKIYEVIEVADKDDSDSLIYDRFMLVCIAASIVPLCFKETNALFIRLDRVTVAVFIADYLLRWWTADLKYEKSGRTARALHWPFRRLTLIRAEYKRSTHKRAPFLIGFDRDHYCFPAR